MSNIKRPPRKPQLQSLLDAPGSPLFLLDHKRKVLFVNTGLTELFGWSAADLLRQQCHYSTVTDPADVQSVLSCLCPPAEVFSGKHQSVPVYVPQKNAAAKARLIHFYPLLDQAGVVEHVVGIITQMHQPEKPASASPAQKLHAELAALRLTIRQRFGFDSLIAHSAPMQRVLQQIQLAIPNRASLFLSGEQGVGKEHIARLIHQKSTLAQRAFVPINCKLLSATDLKTTLKRAIDVESDTREPPPALQAGTIYLKHVSSMPRDIQEWFANRWPNQQQLRLISSDLTGLDPARELEQLRDDFYFLVSTLALSIPPLRERSEDLPALAQYFLELGNQAEQKQITGFAEETWNHFYEYNWPGNLDELADVIAEARQSCRNSLITPADLPFRFRTGLQSQQESPVQTKNLQPLDQKLSTVEAEHIQEALILCQHNKALAADLLGITRAKLYRRMEQLNISGKANDS